MIGDEDFEVGLPTAVDDVNLRSEALCSTSGAPQSSSPFLATLCVSREMSNLLNITKLLTLPSTAIQTCDLQFHECMTTFPAHYPPRKKEALNPSTIAPVIYLQNARLLLHRHNLTNVCTTETRSAAMNHCISVAQDTAQILSRCMMEPLAQDPHSTSHLPLQVFLEPSAIAFLCTHIWRCTLFLCLGINFQAALTCARVSAIIGNARPINTACGRYVDLFLDRLIEKMRHKPRTRIDFDEELIAYVSGDLQGRIEQSWIWHGGEGSRKQSSERFGTEENKTVAIESDVEQAFDKAEWKGILERLDRLAHEHQQEQHFQGQEHSPSTLRDLTHSASSNQIYPQSNAISSNRISIADIMETDAD